MQLGLVVMGMGLIVVTMIKARSLSGWKGKDDEHSPHQGLHDFLRDWDRIQSAQPNEPSSEEQMHVHDHITGEKAISIKDDLSDRSDHHEHSESERERLIREGLILSVPKHASVEEVYHNVELPRIREAHKAGDKTVISEALKDPLELKARDLKFHELLAADVYFSFLTRTVVYFVAVSLLLPAIVPFFSLLSIGVQALVDYYYNQPDVQGDAVLFDVGDQLL